ncbi:hypothetical protein SDC9_48096 [bioreactor metagenome]|uniref:Uncharacterized protein n=1 Tax=bioreactor metagenome TaxID=1076179 RepID=A0A644WDE7_9ZZZZ
MIYKSAVVIRRVRVTRDLEVHRAGRRDCLAAESGVEDYFLPEIQNGVRIGVTRLQCKYSFVFIHSQRGRVGIDCDCLSTYQL